MKEQSSRQALAESIKREVLMDLNRAAGRPEEEQRLIESIKQEVLMELDEHRHSHPLQDRAFAEAVKDEVLAQIREETRAAASSPVHPDRGTVESIKREVLAQIRAEQTNPGEPLVRARDKGLD